MMPFAPSLSVRPLAAEESGLAGALVNRWLQRALYSAPMDEAEVSEQLFGDNPPTLYPVRWQRRQVLGVWRAGECHGLLDAAIGLDSASAILPDYHPLGLVRFFALPERQDLVNDAAQALIDAAIRFWREGGVGHVKVYHISSGYPAFQAGAGMLPGDWADQVRLLTGMGFRFVDRYYCLARPLGLLLEEVVPQGGLSLAFRGSADDRRYQVFYRRTESIAEARLVCKRVLVDGVVRPIGYVAHWEVDERWRNQHIGRWLLRRLLNDATQQSLAEVVVHLQLPQTAAMNLLAQHGFIELNYRGYSLEKSLSE
jgi:ribosomal protein S18 acetylase RimI-like enzyme